MAGIFSNTAEELGADGSSSLLCYEACELREGVIGMQAALSSGTGPAAAS